MVANNMAKISYYAVRTTTGREIDVALVLENRANNIAMLGEDPGVKSIIVPPGIRGYVFIESVKLASVYRLISEVKYVKSTQPIRVSREEIERLIKPKPVIEMIREGDVVEIVRGPFRGMKAQVISVDKDKNMVMLSILEAAFNVPITVPGDYVKPVKKGGV
ncbi:MAG: transcription elongation factor Spt5 [Staphylothermus sp.]|nr:transcription elongation factor Spt5 [Staphylothermus sp.]